MYASFDKSQQLISFAYPVTVNSTVRVSNGNVTSPSVSFINSSNTGIYSPGTNALSLATAGIDRMRITSGGKVGVGTATPSASFDIRTVGDAAAGVSINQVGTGPILVCSSNATTTGVVIANNGNIGVSTGTPQYSVHINTPLSTTTPNILALPPIAILEERAPIGSNSPVIVGTQNGTGWWKRQLNTVVNDGIGLNYNSSTFEFQLPAGTYHILADGIANAVQKHRIGLSNITAARFIALGTTECVPTINNLVVSTRSTMSTIITISTLSTFSLWHWIAIKSPLEPTPGTGASLGYPGATNKADASLGGVDETYARITITKYQ